MDIFKIIYRTLKATNMDILKSLIKDLTWILHRIFSKTKREFYTEYFQGLYVNFIQNFSGIMTLIIEEFQFNFNFKPIIADFSNNFFQGPINH